MTSLQRANSIEDATNPDLFEEVLNIIHSNAQQYGNDSDISPNMSTIISACNSHSEKKAYEVANIILSQLLEHSSGRGRRGGRRGRGRGRGRASLNSGITPRKTYNYNNTRNSVSGNYAANINSSTNGRGGTNSRSSLPGNLPSMSSMNATTTDSNIASTTKTTALKGRRPLTLRPKPAPPLGPKPVKPRPPAVAWGNKKRKRADSNEFGSDSTSSAPVTTSDADGYAPTPKRHCVNTDRQNDVEIEEYVNEDLPPTPEQDHNKKSVFSKVIHSPVKRFNHPLSAQNLIQQAKLKQQANNNNNRASSPEIDMSQEESQQEENMLIEFDNENDLPIAQIKKALESDSTPVWKTLFQSLSSCFDLEILFEYCNLTPFDNLHKELNKLFNMEQQPSEYVNIRDIASEVIVSVSHSADLSSLSSKVFRAEQVPAKSAEQESGNRLRWPSFCKKLGDTIGEVKQMLSNLDIYRATSIRQLNKANQSLNRISNATCMAEIPLKEKMIERKLEAQKLRDDWKNMAMGQKDSSMDQDEMVDCLFDTLFVETDEMKQLKRKGAEVHQLVAETKREQNVLAQRTKVIGIIRKIITDMKTRSILATNNTRDVWSQKLRTLQDTLSGVARPLLEELYDRIKHKANYYQMLHTIVGDAERQKKLIMTNIEFDKSLQKNLDSVNEQIDEHIKRTLIADGLVRDLADDISNFFEEILPNLPSDDFAEKLIPAVNHWVSIWQDEFPEDADNMQPIWDAFTKIPESKPEAIGDENDMDDEDVEDMLNKAITRSRSPSDDMPALMGMGDGSPIANAMKKRVSFSPNPYNRFPYKYRGIDGQMFGANVTSRETLPMKTPEHIRFGSEEIINKWADEGYGLAQPMHSFSQPASLNGHENNAEESMSMSDNENNEEANESHSDGEIPSPLRQQQLSYLLGLQEQQQQEQQQQLEEHEQQQQQEELQQEQQHEQQERFGMGDEDMDVEIVETRPREGADDEISRFIPGYMPAGLSPYASYMDRSSTATEEPTPPPTQQKKKGFMGFLSKLF